MAFLVVGGGLVVLHLTSGGESSTGAGGGIRVVAAENFWGSLARELGGAKVSVLSIVSDPNADPHEYETNTATAVAVAQAQLVIENGAGYDDWCSQLVSASGTPGQRILNVASLLGKVAGDNPHFWYDQGYVNRTVLALYSDLVALDPSNSTYFQVQYALLNESLATVVDREDAIRAEFSNTPVASTESVFVYLANTTGLDLVSPSAFMDAVSEGNDPPAASVTQFENQLQNRSVRVLVYNAQTVTPLTQQMQSLAAVNGIPTVAVTETIQPPDATFVTWMEGELASLSTALQAGVGLP